jgi:MtrB/PioB family decaheme-associated outer membrane protein
MRIDRFIAFASILLLAGLAAPVRAQDSAAETPETTGRIDAGGRVSNIDGDPARYQHYRDLRDGGTLNLLRYDKSTDAWKVNLEADHVGYRDQRYDGSLNVYGKVKVKFEWDQIPLFYSVDTATPYVSASPGVLRIPDSVQGRSLAAVAGAATPFDLRQRRDVANFALTYQATRDLDLNVTFKNMNKNGRQEWGATFGFSNDVEVPVPIDTRTTEFGSSVEWKHGPGLVQVGYDGSFFRNNITTLIWDNPIVAVDSTSGSSQGRMALWPNSDMNQGHITGSLKLPARSVATAFVAVANWSQNDPLIPFTINTALPDIPLDRPTAEAKAIVTTMNYTYTTRPTDALWLNARFRRYDFDNRTPVFRVERTVAYDQNVSAYGHAGTEAFGYIRNTFDGDVSFTPAAVPHAAFRVGYTGEAVDRTFRLFETTRENVLRASIDSTGWQWLTVRGVYEHGKRTGSGLDEEVLDDIGEQITLRQFDISDRTSDRFSAIVQVMPTGSLSFSGTAAAGREDRDAEFGLRSNDNHSFSIGADYVPSDAVSLGAEYSYEHYSTLQASRQANPPPSPQFTDPTRDWMTDAADVAHTFTLSADLLQLAPKTDIRFAYDYSRARSTYVYDLPPDTTLGPIQQLPPVQNALMRATTEVQYRLNRHVAVGGSYWFDRYRVQDYAFSPETLDQLNQPSTLILGYLYRPYTANTVWGHVSYLW